MHNTLPSILTRGVAEVLPDLETLAAKMSQQKITVYIGIDPTGSLLTLGHSVGLRKLQQFAALGHHAILLVGNGTVRIGDPTGKDTTRPVLTDEQIQENFKEWKAQASKVLDFDMIEIRYNGDWLDRLTYADMVKLMATTTVQQLMERDMFQERVAAGKPVHAHEIMYPLLQGYDSVAMNVDLELGGTDQTFNMMMGRTLQRIYNNREKWVLSTPIINGTDGRKMSKSYGNYVALTDEPEEMYGKLMSVTDLEIIPYFDVLTDVADSEIETMKQAMSAGENPMVFKKLLAKTITAQYHDQTAAAQAEEHFAKTVQHKEAVQSLSINNSTITALELIKQARPDLSSGELKRVLSQGGVELNERRITDPQQQLELHEADILKVGKRHRFTLTVST